MFFLLKRVQTLDENTFIDYEELAAFLSNIPPVVNDWPKLRLVLGTRPDEFYVIHTQFVMSIMVPSAIEITIARMLSGWINRIGRESNVGILCHGSCEGKGRNITDGLLKHGFQLAAG
jgi:hypothetical protein